MPVSHLITEIAQRRAGLLSDDSKFVPPEFGNEVFDMHAAIFAQRKESVKPHLCAADIPLLAEPWLNTRMNKQNYRKEWLRRLRDREGSTDALASKIGTDPNYISSILGAKGKRRMGDRVARQIEKTYDLSPGSLDLPSEGAQKIVVETEDMDQDMLDDVLEYIRFKKAAKN